MLPSRPPDPDPLLIRRKLTVPPAPERLVALAARLPHTEAAGLLADAVGDAPLLLVIDELSFNGGRYADATRLVEATLTDDPFREAAHRLEMRLANATGDEDRVIAAYRRCERRLRELGTAPSTSTRQLLETLRR
jgi:hypothetical protein